MPSPPSHSYVPIDWYATWPPGVTRVTSPPRSRPTRCQPFTGRTVRNAIECRRAARQIRSKAVQERHRATQLRHRNPIAQA
jgi:hypothetical protein